MKIKLKRFSSFARVPARATKGSAGFDLFSTENIKLDLHTVNTISTNTGFKIPKNYFGKIHLTLAMHLNLLMLLQVLLIPITEGKFLLFSLIFQANVVR